MTHANKQIKGEKRLKTIKISTPVGVSARKRTSIAAKLEDQDYRESYVETIVTHGIAHQVRVNRELRGWSQKELGRLCALEKKQSSISRLEDPAYGKYSIQTLLEIAKAFDVALIVKFVPFSKFLTETSKKTPEALFAKSYKDEDLYLSVAQFTVYEECLTISSTVKFAETKNTISSMDSLDMFSCFISNKNIQDTNTVSSFMIDDMQVV